MCQKDCQRPEREVLATLEALLPALVGRERFPPFPPLLEEREDRADGAGPVSSLGEEEEAIPFSVVDFSSGVGIATSTSTWNT